MGPDFIGFWKFAGFLQKLSSTLYTRSNPLESGHDCYPQTLPM